MQHLGSPDTTPSCRYRDSSHERMMHATNPLPELTLEEEQDCSLKPLGSPDKTPSCHNPDSSHERMMHAGNSLPGPTLEEEQDCSLKHLGSPDTTPSCHKPDSSHERMMHATNPLPELNLQEEQDCSLKHLGSPDTTPSCCYRDSSHERMMHAANSPPGPTLEEEQDRSLKRLGSPDTTPSCRYPDSSHERLIHPSLRSLTIFPALKAQEKVPFNVTSLIEIMILFVNFSSSSALRHIMDVSHGIRPRPMRKNGYLVFILCSLLTMALAATDCEILNSGISSISSTACCTETEGIICVNGRVTEM
jgi:hypothetical protein